MNSRPSRAMRVLTIMCLAVSGCASEPPEASAPPKADAAPDQWPAMLENAVEQDPPGVRWIPNPRQAPYLVAAHPGGRLVALTSSCETIVFDLLTGKQLHAWPLPTTVLQFSPDGKFLLTRRDSVIALWEIDGFKLRREYAGQRPSWQLAQQKSRPTAAISENNAWIAVSNSQRMFDQAQPASVLLLNQDGKQRHAFTIPPAAKIQSIHFLSNDRLLATAGVANEQRYSQQSWLWNIESGELVCEFPFGAAVKASNDGRWVAALDRFPDDHDASQGPPPMDLAVYVTATGEIVRRLQRDHPVRDFALHPDGEHLLIPVQDRLFEYDARTWKGQFVSTAQGKPIANVAYSPSGARRFATVEVPSGVDDDVDHVLRAWDVKLNKPLEIAEFSFASYNGLQKLFFFPDGDRFVDRIGEFAVRDIFTGDTVQAAPKLRVPESYVAISPDRHYFYTRGLLTEAATGRQRSWNLDGDQHEFVDNGQTMFSHNYSGLFLTDVRSGVLKQRLGPEAATRTAACSPDGVHIVQCVHYTWLTPISRLIVFDARRPDAPVIAPGNASALAVAPDGKHFVAATGDGIFQHDLATAQQTRLLWKPPGRVLQIKFSPDGNTLLAVGVTGHEDDNQPIGRDDDGWAQIFSFETAQTRGLKGHTGPVYCVDYSADGGRCVTGGDDGTIRLWDVATATSLHTFAGHRGGIRDLAYAPREDRILAAADDGAAFHEIAGIVEPNADLSPIADEFTTIEGINAWNGYRHQNLQGRLFPEPTDEVPQNNGAGWSLIHVGKPFQLINCPTRWLSRARTTRQLGRRKPIYDVRIPGYEQQDATPDQRRRVLRSRSEQRVVVKDDLDRTLLSVDDQTQDVAAKISSDGKLLSAVQLIERATAIRANGRYRLRVFDIDSGLVQTELEDVAARYGIDVMFAPDNQTMLLQINNALEIRATKTGQLLSRLPAGEKHDQNIDRVLYSPDGQFVATWQNMQPYVELRDPRTLEVKTRIATDLPVRWIRFLPSSKGLLVGQPFLDYRTLITAYDVPTGHRKWCHAGPASQDGDFTANERYFVTHQSELWALWDLEVAQLECVIEIEGNNIADRPVFGPTGTTLHLGTTAGTVLWSAAGEEAPKPKTAKGGA